VWDSGSGYGGDHLRAAFYDGGVFGFGADHEAGDVLKEDYGGVSKRVCKSGSNAVEEWK
jgi:hypothetical protein